MFLPAEHHLAYQASQTRIVSRRSLPPEDPGPLDGDLHTESLLKWDFINIEIPPLAPVYRAFITSRNRYFFLPLELWLVISSHSTFEAIRTLSLTCKILRSSMLPLLFHDVRLRVRGELWQRRQLHALPDSINTGSFITRLFKNYQSLSPSKQNLTAVNQKLRTRLEFYASEQIAPVIRRVFVGIRPEDFDESRGGEETVDLIFSTFLRLPNLAFIAFHGTTFTPHRIRLLHRQFSNAGVELKTIVIDQCLTPSGHIDLAPLRLTGLQVSKQTTIVEFNHDFVETLQVDGPELLVLTPDATLPLLRTLTCPLIYLAAFLTDHGCPSLLSITTYGSHQIVFPDSLPSIPLQLFAGPAFLAAALSNASGSKLRHVDLSSCDHLCLHGCDLSQSLLRLSQLASMQLVTLTLRMPFFADVVGSAICTFERLEELRIFTEPGGDLEVRNALPSFLYLPSLIFLSLDPPFIDFHSKNYPTPVPSHYFIARCHN
jgi:hypothetical protein